jgi:hypothetical protein
MVLPQRQLYLRFLFSELLVLTRLRENVGAMQLLMEDVLFMEQLQDENVLRIDDFKHFPRSVELYLLRCNHHAGYFHFIGLSGSILR